MRLDQSCRRETAPQRIKLATRFMNLYSPKARINYGEPLLEDWGRWRVDAWTKTK
jgi:hypothetical protein